MLPVRTGRCLVWSGSSFCTDCSAVTSRAPPLELGLDYLPLPATAKPCLSARPMVPPACGVTDARVPTPGAGRSDQDPQRGPERTTLAEQVDGAVKVDVSAGAEDERIRGWVTGLLQLFRTPTTDGIVLCHPRCEDCRRHRQDRRNVCDPGRDGCSHAAPEHIGQWSGAIRTTTP